MARIHEICRTYYFPCDQKIVIPHVRKLHVSESGNHRLVTEDKRLHIIPPSWLHIEIVSDKGWEV